MEDKNNMQINNEDMENILELGAAKGLNVALGIGEDPGV